VSRTQRVRGQSNPVRAWSNEPSACVVKRTQRVRGQTNPACTWSNEPSVYVVNEPSACVVSRAWLGAQAWKRFADFEDEVLEFGDTAGVGRFLFEPFEDGLPVLSGESWAELTNPNHLRRHQLPDGCISGGVEFCLKSGRPQGILDPNHAPS
jgi:hypothetical protein